VYDKHNNRSATSYSFPNRFTKSPCMWLMTITTRSCEASLFSNLRRRERLCANVKHTKGHSLALMTRSARRVAPVQLIRHWCHFLGKVLRISTNLIDMIWNTILDREGFMRCHSAILPALTRSHSRSDGRVFEVPRLSLKNKC
jgi:hypothetical protein